MRDRYAVQAIPTVETKGCASRQLSVSKDNMVHSQSEVAEE